MPATPPPAADEPELEYSPLERAVERDGVRVRICIYRGEGDPGWLLEVEDHLGGSTVWDDPFATDREALDEALRAIDEDGIESFAKASGDPALGRRLWTITCSRPPIAELKRMLEASPKLLNFQAICGLFAAVATAPALVPPSSWLPTVLGEHTFANQREAAAFTGALMALYEEVLRTLGDHDACFCPDPSDRDAVLEFCSGYVGIVLRDDLWNDDKRCYPEVLRMLALAGAAPVEKVGEHWPAAADNPDAWLQEGREALPVTVLEMYTYWAGEREAFAARHARNAQPVQRASPKVGRNDPCPCGSGKKFKRCCAN
jgi:uncharacterized protein